MNVFAYVAAVLLHHSQAVSAPLSLTGYLQNDCLFSPLQTSNSGSTMHTSCTSYSHQQTCWNRRINRLTNILHRLSFSVVDFTHDNQLIRINIHQFVHCFASIITDLPFRYLINQVTRCVTYIYTIPSLSQHSITQHADSGIYIFSPINVLAFAPKPITGRPQHVQNVAYIAERGSIHLF